MTASPSEAPPPPPDVPAGVRAQILATEHWSLLATRSMTWSEVMSRITIHLTVASASLVVLALFAQASGFGGAFRVMAIGLAAAVLVMGTLTQIRVVNASIDDASTILGMNRLRAAYLDLDPGLAPYLVTSPHDDQQGLMQTYLMGWPRSTLSHVAGSTSIFMTVINAIVAGTLGALVADAAGGGAAVVVVLGTVCGVGYVVAQLVIGQRSFATPRQDSRFPTPSTGD
ncbi:hypothetical protein SAMN04489867_1694 [Pedococcus dokdonensis]|uniref:Uncharacterized protein n=1 Tax=Pedococcus dokdonensis TaxID=443156 RepID=A0A1H0QQD6_9MICO|nr:hypothetical protein [Pedococcus dokdonensis]SDP19482.1 hypothetical protein SAMN04489867_1694 [Pedococcus dokdonensis]